VPLTLLVGPANAGKVAHLLDRYLAAIDRDPVLVVPTGSDVERVERDLLVRSPALMAGSIGTFDDLFARIVRGVGRPLLTDAQRALLLAQVVARTPLDGLGESARFAGFAAALLEPEELDGRLAALHRAYRDELDRLGLWDRDRERRFAAERVAGDLDAWDGAPVFAYGFEDLSGAQWTLLEALAARAEVTVSLPYEPGRPAFASLARTADDLARLADGRVEELSAQDWRNAPALAYLERVLFDERAAGEPGHPEPPRLEGAVRFLEAAGARAALELVGDEVLALLRAGTPAEEIAIVCPGVERWRAPLETAFGGLDVPYAVEGQIGLGRTPFGRALLGLLRFAWLGGGRRELYAYLRSPYSGLPRHRADFAEGRLRGRAVTEAERVETETVRLLGHPIPALETLRSEVDPIAGARAVVGLMLRGAYGLAAPPVGEGARLDLRAHEQALELLTELDGWRRLGHEVGYDHVAGALERRPVRLASAGEPGRVAVLDLLRARTRRFQAVFVLGLEEGVFPRRSSETPFLPDERRRELEGARRGRRLVRPDSVARERYLFYTACTRARQRLTLVREAANEDGRPLQPSPFYEEVRSRFDPGDVAVWTRRRRLSALAWELERAPTERERLRAAAGLAAGDESEALALARANGWERRLERAVNAFRRSTRLTHPTVLAQLHDTTRFSVTELESFGACSSMWLFERVVDPKEIDAEVDQRLRGSVAHQALYRFYTGLPKRLGVERVDGERLDEALDFLRECLVEAIDGKARLELSELERLELEGVLARDLEHFLRQEVELELSFVPRRFEVSFGTDSAPVELQRGLDLGGFTVSGKIDRIDVDPMSARGIVQDYKLGRAFSAREIRDDRRLQIPLYMLALRDLVGIEPLGGLYRGLSGARDARGILRQDAREDVPGFTRTDYLDEGEFWAAVEDAQDAARGAVARIRTGDVRHDPRGGDCPHWCKVWPMCRVARA
jgi:hypothetical protein